MTSFHAPLVYQCPACDGFVLRPQLRTLNFTGAQDWSDGAPSTWWSVGLQPLVRCATCTRAFWIEDLVPLGEVPYQPRPIGRVERVVARWRGDPKGRLQEEWEWLQIPAGWKTAERVDAIELEDLAAVLDKPVGLGHDKLLWLRRSLWWRLNDRHRTRSDVSPIPDAPTLTGFDERANMRELLALLEQSEMDASDMVEKGELLRQLGHFYDAVAVLKAVPADGYNEVRAVQIEALARAGDRVVRALRE